MKAACNAFRTLLEKKLTGRPDPTGLIALSWHEHLLGCGACREIFQGEEALEELLAALPEPNLAPEIKRRVLVALAKSRARETALDALLGRDAATVVPAGLARSVLAGLEDARRLAPASSSGADRLDALLDRDHVTVPSNLARRTIARLADARQESTLALAKATVGLDALLDRAARVDVPRALGRRVLAGLAAERTVAPQRAFALVRSPWMYAAAGLLVATLLAWTLWRKGEPAVKPDFVNGPGPRSEMRGNDRSTATVPDAQMLAALDVLENWDILMVNDVDVLLSTIEPADEVLLDYEDEG